MEHEPVELLPCKWELKKLAQEYMQELGERLRYDKEGEVMEWLFRTFPRNTDINEVLVKIMSLDSSYSTNLRRNSLVMLMAKKITSISNFNERIKKRDLSIVDELCDLKEKNDDQEKGRPFSFASKYCCIQNLNLEFNYGEKRRGYAIYDSFVAKVLTWYQENDDFLGKNNRTKLKDYWGQKPYKSRNKQSAKFEYRDDKLKESYRNFYFPIISCFQYYHKLTRFTLRDLDHFLWRMGREYFLGYQIAKLRRYVIKIEGKAKLKIQIYKKCPITELNRVKETLKYSKYNFQRGPNEKDNEYALRILKSFYVCVNRHEGIVGEYYIEEANTVKLYRKIYDSETKKYMPQEDILPDLLKVARAEYGVINAGKVASLKDVCQEVLALYKKVQEEKRKENENQINT